MFVMKVFMPKFLVFRSGFANKTYSTFCSRQRHFANQTEYTALAQGGWTQKRILPIVHPRNQESAPVGFIVPGLSRVKISTIICPENPFWRIFRGEIPTIKTPDKILSP